MRIGPDRTDAAPREIEGAADRIVHPAQAQIPRPETRTDTTVICSAEERDLDAIGALSRRFPADAKDAEKRGFIRPRFNREELLTLIDQNNLWAVRRGEDVIGYFAAMDWKDPMLSLERLAVRSFFGWSPTTWSGRDYVEASEGREIVYIAEAAMDPDCHAWSRGKAILGGFRLLRRTHSDALLFTTTSGAPVRNFHSEKMLRILGFEPVGAVHLPLRPFPRENFPFFQIVRGFASNIWVFDPATRDTGE